MERCFPGSRGRGWRAWVAPLVIALAALAVLHPVVGHDFLDYDDAVYVFKNPIVKDGVTAVGLRAAFAVNYEAGNWHPLTWISHMLDVQLFGLDPRWHHAVGLAFHALNAALLFASLQLMTGAAGPSFLAALLFAVHPLHVESVAWVAERKDVLSTLFLALALLAYRAYARRPGVGRYLAVMAALAFGLMAKSMLVTLPFVLLLLDFWPLGRTGSVAAAGNRRLAGFPRGSLLLLVAEKLPLLVPAVLSGALTYLAQSRGGATTSLEHLPLSARAANGLVSCAVYLAQTLWPAGLAVLYPHPLRMLPWAQVLPSALLIAGGTWACLRERGRHPYLAVGWLWYLLTLAPVIGLIQVGAQARSDRYTYVPLVGIFLAAAWGGVDLARRDPRLRRVLAAAAACTLLALMILSGRQVRYWRDGITLFTHAAEVTTRNWRAEFNIGTYLMAAGRAREAEGHFLRCLEWNPAYAGVHNNLGNLYFGWGRLRDATRHYLEAARLDPADADCRFNLGLVAMRQGEYAEAERRNRETLLRKRDYVWAHNNLAVVLVEQGKYAEALDHLLRAIALDPGSAQFQFSAGQVLASLGRSGEALARYREALRLKPDYAEARLEIAKSAPRR